MRSIVRRLTGFVTAVAVAVCPTMFVVCAEQCAHAAVLASHTNHVADAEPTHQMPARVATLHGHAEGAADDAVRDVEPCHHEGATPSEAADVAAVTLPAQGAVAEASHLAPTCSSCFGEAPVLLATRNGDDSARAYNSGAALVASLPTRLLLSGRVEIHAPGPTLRLGSPPVPPSSSLVLRI